MARQPRKKESRKVALPYGALFTSEIQAQRVAGHETSRRLNACPAMLRPSRLPYHAGWIRGQQFADVVALFEER